MIEEEDFEDLLASLRRPSDRANAALALGAAGDLRAIPPLREALRRRGGHWFEDLAVAAALARLGDEAGFQELTERANARGAADRFAALEALGEVRAPDAFALLSGAAEETDPLVQGAAIRALGKLGDQRAIPMLRVRLSQAATDECVLDCAEALLRLGESPDELSAARPKGEEALAQLRELLATDWARDP